MTAATYGSRPRGAEPTVRLTSPVPARSRQTRPAATPVEYASSSARSGPPEFSAELARSDRRNGAMAVGGLVVLVVAGVLALTFAMVELLHALYRYFV